MTIFLSIRTNAKPIDPAGFHRGHERRDIRIRRDIPRVEQGDGNVTVDRLCQTLNDIVVRVVASLGVG